MNDPVSPPDLSSLLYQAGHPLPLTLSFISPRNFDPNSSVVRRMMTPHRTNHYFLLFVKEGELGYTVDLRPFSAKADQALFILPHQVRVPPASKGSEDFFKLTLDESCLARLPRVYRFWLDPLSSQLIPLPAEVRQRVWSVLGLLEDAWAGGTGSPDLVLGYLNALMSELETAYFEGAARRTEDRDLETFLRFKTLVEERFKTQPRVADLARTLGLSETRLYTVVKAFTGISPKEFLTKRTIVEAQRLLFYSRPSVKELTRRLGFDDESYFSRLFKKEAGRSVSAFVASLEEKSGIGEDSSIPLTAVLD